LRRRGGERKGAPATQQDICPALSDVYHAQYRSPIRLTVLLTGDADAAEAVVLDSFAALHRLRKRPQTEDDALPHLRRLLVARSRLARHHHLWDGSRRPPAGAGLPGCTGTPHGAPRPEGSAVTCSLHAANQPAGSDRLTSYLILSPDQAAAAMRVSLATVRRRLAEARSALRAVPPSNP
jgi:hypothetical protein